MSPAVTLRHPIYCLNCNYPLNGLPREECPECGRRFSLKDCSTYRCAHRRRWTPLHSLARALLILASFANLLLAAPMAFVSFDGVFACLILIGVGLLGLKVAGK